MNTRKTAIVSCYFQPNYGSMLQALATQMALDRLGYDNETICIDGLKKEIRLVLRRSLSHFGYPAFQSRHGYGKGAPEAFKGNLHPDDAGKAAGFFRF